MAAGYRAGHQRRITGLVCTVLGRGEVYPWNHSDVALGQAAGHLRTDYTPELRDKVFEYYREDFGTFRHDVEFPRVGMIWLRGHSCLRGRSAI